MKKQFFFEKKNQKTFANWPRSPRLDLPSGPWCQLAKVFWFFFSKKNTLPSFVTPGEPT
jgi:hypothetical protein